MTNPFLPVVDVERRLCAEVNGAIQSGDANLLRQIVQIEPPDFQPVHHDLVQSLKNNYPDDENTEERLEELIKQTVFETHESEDPDGRPVQSWSSFAAFLVNWMAFLRDYRTIERNLLEVYERLKELME